MVRQGEERWRIIGRIYAGRWMEVAIGNLERWVNERGEERKVIIGGDFNTRTGREREGLEEGGKEIRKKATKDVVVNPEGRKLIRFVEENRWDIFNGCIRGDEEGEFTYTGGKGNTIIDYVIEEIEVRDRVEYMKIGDRIDSDHQPLEIMIKCGGEWRERRRRGKREWK